MAIVVGDAVSPAETLDLLGRVHAAAESTTPAEGAQFSRESVDPPLLDAERAASPPWTLTIYPGSLADAEAALTEILAVEAVEGTTGIGRYDGWPDVTIDKIDHFGEVFTDVAKLPMFADGGTYVLFDSDERLRIVHTPLWVTDALIQEVIAISRDYPHAEVLLEAPRGGGEQPTLYIARLTPDDVVTISARLTAVAGSSTPGTRISFVLGTLGADGVTYTEGIIGEPS